MGKVMRHTLGASLNIRHNLSSSKGPKPLQLKLLTTYIPKTSAFTLAFSTSQRLRTTRIASIMENTNLSKQQQVSEIMRQMLTQAQTAGQYFTNDQIKEMTRKVSAEVDLVHQQTQNQRYGSSHIGA